MFRWVFQESSNQERNDIRIMPKPFFLQRYIYNYIICVCHRLNHIVMMILTWSVFLSAVNEPTFQVPELFISNILPISFLGSSPKHIFIVSSSPLFFIRVKFHPKYGFISPDFFTKCKCYLPFFPIRICRVFFPSWWSELGPCFWALSMSQLFKFLIPNLRSLFPHFD